MKLLLKLVFVIFFSSTTQIHSTGAINCTQSGSFCSNLQADCNKVYICIATSSNTWTVLEYDCEDGENCYDGGCTTRPNPNCVYENTSFRCKSLAGMYPDPSSCNKLHICAESGDDSEMKQYDAECEDGYGYNPLTTYCDVTLDNERCSIKNEVVPVCQDLGENNALQSNPVLYYICLPSYDDSGNGSFFYPYIYMCPNGRNYLGDYTCSEDVETSTYDDSSMYQIE